MVNKNYRKTRRSVIEYIIGKGFSSCCDDLDDIGGGCAVTAGIETTVHYTCESDVDKGNIKYDPNEPSTITSYPLVGPAVWKEITGVLTTDSNATYENITIKLNGFNAALLTALRKVDGQIVTVSYRHNGQNVLHKSAIVETPTYDTLTASDPKNNPTHTIVFKITGESLPFIYTGTF